MTGCDAKEEREWRGLSTLAPWKSREEQILFLYTHDRQKGLGRALLRFTRVNPSLQESRE